MAQELLPIGEFVDHRRGFEEEPITRDRLDLERREVQECHPGEMTPLLPAPRSRT